MLNHSSKSISIAAVSPSAAVKVKFTIGQKLSGEEFSKRTPSSIATSSLLFKAA